MKKTWNILDTFAGIGGFSLGMEKTGRFKTVGFVEINPYPCKILQRHWPGVPIYNDIREFTAERVRSDRLIRERIDIITGGFPCTDVSVAGKRAGITGEATGLWKELARIIGEFRPTYAIMENVSALLAGDRGLWFGEVLGDLAALGYDAEWHCITASSVGAPHRRDRVWIIAHTDEQRGGERIVPQPDVEHDIRKPPKLRNEKGKTESKLADSESGGLEPGRRPGDAKVQRTDGAAYTNDGGSKVADSDRPDERRRLQPERIQDQRDADASRDGSKGSIVADAERPGKPADSGNDRGNEGVTERDPRTPLSAGEEVAHTTDAFESGAYLADAGLSEPSGRGESTQGQQSKERRKARRESTSRGRNVADSESLTERAGLRESGQRGERRRRSGDGNSEVPDTLGERLENLLEARTASPTANGFGARNHREWWAVEPDVGRVANGIPDRMERLKALGNAIVPEIATLIAEAIIEREDAVK